MPADGQRPHKRRRVEMPTVPDGFNFAMPKVTRPIPKPQGLHLPPKTPLKQIIPPSFPLPNNTVNTKLLYPPSIQLKTPLNLKTISTTSLGILNSSNGGEDLAAFLLPHRDQSSTVSPTSRGVDISPEKKGKGNNPKFIRGGLAARASALYNRAHTNLVLWHKETERRSNSRTKPALTVTIVRILYLPRSNSNRPSSVITLCRIHDQSDSTYSPSQLYKIIFSLPQLSIDRFKADITVRIFHPWHELSFTHTTDSSTSLHSRPPPTSLPLPLSLPPTPDLPINYTTALLCSRFIF